MGYENGNGVANILFRGVFRVPQEANAKVRPRSRLRPRKGYHECLRYRGSTSLGKSEKAKRACLTLSLNTAVNDFCVSSMNREEGSVQHRDCRDSSEIIDAKLAVK
ncbi:hypothetical protein R1flu_022269 [Riccia fluitans]|uniref:Uncharacterized protein n=1 Tax=Riccia fluitans TaxID=41844 RepID=A0ABD1ZT13_9MARC